MKGARNRNEDEEDKPLPQRKRRKQDTKVPSSASDTKRMMRRYWWQSAIGYDGVALPKMIMHLSMFIHELQKRWCEMLAVHQSGLVIAS